MYGRAFSSKNIRTTSNLSVPKAKMFALKKYSTDFQIEFFMYLRAIWRSVNSLERLKFLFLTASVN